MSPDGNRAAAVRTGILHSQLSRFSPTIAALVLTAALASAVIGVLPPFWNGNDDLAMSMIAEGYGLAAYPSPALAVSNILYGYMICWMPQIGDVSRYSCASIALNVLATFFICRALCLLAPNFLLALAVTVLAALLPLTFPRFTVLAAMLTLAGLLQALVHLRDRRVLDLIIAGILLFMGYLVRSQSFYLVLMVSFVLLPWKELFARRSLGLASIGLAGAIAAAMLADWSYYQRPEWTAFLEFGLPRMGALTDFGIGGHILSHPDLLRDTNYSLNDMLLLRSWWFVDPVISDPRRVSDLLARVSAPAWLAGNLMQTMGAFGTLFQAPLLFVFLPSIATSAFAENRIRLALAWMALLIIIAGLGLVGRSAAIAYVIYGPLVLMLCFGVIRIKQSLVQLGLVGLVVFCAVAQVAGLAKLHAQHMQDYTRAAGDLAALDKSKLYVLWASAMPLQSIYPVLGSMAAVRGFRWYGIGWGSLAPFAMAHWNDAPGGLPRRLLTGDPIPLIATAAQMKLLSVYCEERLGAKMRMVDTRKLQIGTIFTVTCR